MVLVSQAMGIFTQIHIRRIIIPPTNTDFLAAFIMWLTYYKLCGIMWKIIIAKCNYIAINLPHLFNHHQPNALYYSDFVAFEHDLSEKSNQLIYNTLAILPTNIYRRIFTKADL